MECGWRWAPEARQGHCCPLLLMPPIHRGCFPCCLVNFGCELNFWRCLSPRRTVLVPAGTRVCCCSGPTQPPLLTPGPCQVSASVLHLARQGLVNHLVHLSETPVDAPFVYLLSLRFKSKVDDLSSFPMKNE